MAVRGEEEEGVNGLGQHDHPASHLQEGRKVLKQTGAGGVGTEGGVTARQLERRTRAAELCMPWRNEGSEESSGKDDWVAPMGPFGIPGVG